MGKVQDIINQLTQVATQVQAKAPNIANDIKKVVWASEIESIPKNDADRLVYVVNMLQELLKDEYLQQDLYQAYEFLLQGPGSIGIKEHLVEHLEEEMSHVRTLQRYLVSYSQIPTLERHPIPSIAPNMKAIMHKDLEREQAAVENYSKAIAMLEGLNDDKYTSLRVDLENILAQEQEHTHDLERWLAGK